MAMESQPAGRQQLLAGGALRWTFLFLSIALMFLGGTAAPIVNRMYFLHGGALQWLNSLLQNCGFPILFLPLAISYLRRKGPSAGARVFSVTGRGAAALMVIGLGSGLGAYLYAYAASWLPVSTSTLLGATQLAFTAVLAFFVVGQKFTAYSVNAVVMLLIGPAILSLQSSGDRPAGESNRQYYLGFFLQLGASVLSGSSMPLIELTCRRMKRKGTPVLAMEIQVVIAVSATAFCVVGMLAHKDFQAIRREAKEYGLGETKYYIVLSGCAIFWQLLNVGYMGVIACSSSLLAGILMAMLIPVGEITPVLVLHEKFNGGKAAAMALCIWGFVSYLYGEHKQHKKREQAVDKELGLLPAQQPCDPEEASASIVSNGSK